MNLETNECQTPLHKIVEIIHNARNYMGVYFICQICHTKKFFVFREKDYFDFQWYCNSCGQEKDGYIYMRTCNECDTEYVHCHTCDLCLCTLCRSGSTKCSNCGENYPPM